MKWLKIHPIPKEEIMESAINELISEFNEYWEKQDVTHNSQADFLNMIMRAYGIGKVHSFQDGNAEGFKNGLKVGREEMRQIDEQRKIKGQQEKCSVLEYYNVSYSDNTTKKEN